MTTNNHDLPEKDALSGVETTGHEWDGIKELNNPLPRWWLWIFYLCILYSIGYWVIYPAWPTWSGHTKGITGWTAYTKLTADQAEIQGTQATYLQKLHQADLSQIQQDPELYAFAMAGGSAAFKNNCAQCHGTGAAGGNGYPNLNDDDWLWGGKIDEIEQTLRYGIRSGHEQTRVSQMPAFGRDGILKQEQISIVADYVLTLSGGNKTSTYDKGTKIFSENCASCHGAEGKGGRSVGAPNLSDTIWLYGGDRNMVIKTVTNGRGGVMPYWSGRLDEDTIRELATYIHSLGGGE